MVYGLTASAHPHNSDPLSVATPSVIDIIEDDPTAQRIYLVIATPYDPVAEAETSIYLATAAYTSASTDSPAEEPFDETLTNPLNREVQIFQENSPLAGTIIPSAGSKLVVNSDGAYDAWINYEWEGRTLKTYLTLPGRSLANSAQIAESKASGLKWGLDQIEIPESDFRLRLSKTINETTYAGTGGLEGGDSIKGKPKPTVWGAFQRFEPVLVDAANHIYQVHDGAIESVSRVDDQGVNDVSFNADVADITASAPPTGKYNTSLANGYIRLGEAPAGAVTVTGEGDNGGSLGYRDDPAGIIRKIAVQKLGFSDPADFDTGAFQDISASITDSVQFVTRFDQVDGLAAFTEISSPLVYVTFTRLGKLTVGQVTDPSAATADIELDSESLVEPSEGGIFDGQLITPTKKVRVGHTEYHKTLSTEEVAGAVTDANRLDYGEQFRYSEDEDATVETRVPEAKILEVISSLTASASGDTEATRLLGLLSGTQHLLQVEVTGKLFSYELGNIINITRARYDLTNGKKFVLLGYVENVGEGSNAEEIILTLWAPT